MNWPGFSAIPCRNVLKLKNYAECTKAVRDRGWEQQRELVVLQQLGIEELTNSRQGRAARHEARRPDRRISSYLLNRLSWTARRWRLRCDRRRRFMIGPVPGP
jgi:hypothetical protein